MEGISEKTVYGKRSRSRDTLMEHARLHYWYLGWKARMAAREKKKDESEPEPEHKIKTISVGEVPRGFIY